MITRAATAGVAREIHNNLLVVNQIGKGQDWALAKQLYALRRFDLWRFAVGGYDSWEDYLKQPELGISRHKADKLIRIYEYFIVSKKYDLENLKDVPWYALDFISKKNTPADKVMELLLDAKHLTPKDFKETYFDITNGGDRTYSYVLMKKCDQTGSLEKVHELDSETIRTKLGL